MTFDQQLEYDYRLAERLGILCGANAPNTQELALAKAEADRWLAAQPTGKINWRKPKPDRP